MEDILRSQGYETVTAESGLEAIERVQKNGMKVVLMDFRMPGMNGVETFREVMKLNSNLKVIFITAFYNEEATTEALNEGAISCRCLHL